MKRGLFGRIFHVRHPAGAVSPCIAAIALPDGSYRFISPKVVEVSYRRRRKYFARNPIADAILGD